MSKPGLDELVCVRACVRLLRSSRFLVVAGREGNKQALIGQKAAINSDEHTVCLRCLCAWAANPLA